MHDILEGGASADEAKVGEHGSFKRWTWWKLRLAVDGGSREIREVAATQAGATGAEKAARLFKPIDRGVASAAGGA